MTRSRIRSRRFRTARRARPAGFSLVEVAIVLAILGLLLRATVVPLASFEESRKRHATDAALERARGALIARLASHGALPCPSPATGPAASRAVDACPTLRGALPGALLGLPGPVDGRGAALDAWGRPIVYALSRFEARDLPVWSTPGATREVGIEALRGDLAVCREAPRAGCPRAAARAEDLVFVLLSHGADAGDEDLQAINRGDGPVFTLAPESRVPGRRFDDRLAWASRSELVYWLLRANRLP